MQQFMKMRKRIAMSESTRQVLNRAIDLLHKLSNKKVSLEEAKKELSNLLSNHLLYPRTKSSFDDQSKVKLELIMSQGSDILEKLENGKIPLYEAIMLINRVIVSSEPQEMPISELNKKIEPIQFRPRFESKIMEEEFVSQEFDLPGDQTEKNLSTQQVIPIKEEPSPAPPQEIIENHDKIDMTKLLEKVVHQKKLLEESVQALNDSLKTIGFELKPLGK